MSHTAVLVEMLFHHEGLLTVAYLEMARKSKNSDHTALHMGRNEITFTQPFITCLCTTLYISYITSAKSQEVVLCSTTS